MCLKGSIYHVVTNQENRVQFPAQFEIKGHGWYLMVRSVMASGQRSNPNLELKQQLDCFVTEFTLSAVEGLLANDGF